MTALNKQALHVPERKRRDWSQAVMRDCDFCSQWSLTVHHEDGGCICASCCDAEYTSELKGALESAIERAEAAEKRIAEQREYYEGVIADGSRRIAELEANKGKPVMFIDGDISASDAEKLAAVIREWDDAPATVAPEEMESRTATLPDVEKWRSVDAVRAQSAYKVLVSKALTAAGIGVKGE